MSLNNYLLNYTKDWRNAADFPTYEAKETKVREDMQLLFEEMKNAFNRFVADMSAGILPFTSSTAVPADNVQEAILNVQQQITQAIAGEIPNRSLGAEKLEEKTITSEELGNACVVTRVLADDAVTADKLADEAVTADKLAPRAVGADKIVEYCITENLLAANVVSGAKIKDGAVSGGKIADAAVTAAKLADAAVEEAKIKPGAVSAGKIADGSVTSDKLDSGAVITAKIADSAISSAKVADGAVTSDKIGANAVSSSYTGVLTTAGWLGGSAPYGQEVSINGILADDDPVVDLVPSNTYSVALNEETQWGYVYKVDASAGKLTFYATDKPNIAMNFKARCIRK